jgi:drug/metabolite transporter (DMT)-like permease
VAALGSVFYGGADFSGGLAAKRSSALVVTCFSGFAAIAVLVAGLPFVHGVLRTSDLLWGAAAGACGGVSAALIYRALAIGPVSIASPVLCVTGIAFPVLVALLLGERPGALAIMGIGLATLSIVLLAQVGEEQLPVVPPGSEGASGGSTAASPSVRHHVRRVLIASIAAGLGAGLFLVLIGRIQQGAGLWPLIGARVVAIVLLAGWLLSRRQTIVPPPGSRVLSLAAGAFDSFANLSFVWAVQRGSLALVAALVSLSPATAVLLARGILHERWSVPQRVGLAMALLAGVLISIG